MRKRLQGPHRSGSDTVALLKGSLPTKYSPPGGTVDSNGKRKASWVLSWNRNQQTTSIMTLIGAFFTIYWLTRGSKVDEVRAGVPRARRRHFWLLMPPSLVDDSHRTTLMQPKSVQWNYSEKYGHYGGLSIGALPPRTVRGILDDKEPAVGVQKVHGVPKTSRHYFALDDDVVRDTYQYYPQVPSGTCRRSALDRQLRVACNRVHEVDCVAGTFEDTLTYLGKGGYRYAYRLEQGDERVVFKSFRLDKTDYDEEVYEYGRIDALVPDLLTSSPYIVNIYGYCGISHLSELMSKGTLEPHVYPHFERYKRTYKTYTKDERLHMNLLKPEEKVVIARQMAEAVAYMHNFPLGQVIHTDIWVAQFLPTTNWTETGIALDGRPILKLNDFNRALFSTYDAQRQTYCRQPRGCGVGDWHSPEYYRCELIDDKEDIWALGFNIYAIVTGFWVYPDAPTDKMMQNMAIRGELPLIPEGLANRSRAEDMLLEIMVQCLAYKPDDRPDISALVQRLRQVEHTLSIGGRGG